MSLSAVYCSRSRSSKTYAEMFAKIMKCNCVSITGPVPDGDIVFFGWISGGGKLNGYDQLNHGNLLAVCAVGLNYPSEDIIYSIEHKNNITVPVYYCMGCIDRSCLKPSEKFLLSVICLFTHFKCKGQQGDVLRDVIKHGGTFVSEDQLYPLIEYCTAVKKRS